VGDNNNAFDLASFFGNKHFKLKMPRRDRREKKKQVELLEAATGLKYQEVLQYMPYCSKYSVGAEHAAI